MSLDFFIFAVLLLINALMALAMLLASRTLEQPVMARLLACAFGNNVVMYLGNAAYLFLFRDNVWLDLAVSSLALSPPIFASIAYRLRSGLALHVRGFVIAYILAILAMVWFEFGYKDHGFESAVVPIFAAGVLLYGTTALLRRGRRLRLGERPIIITSYGMAAVEFAGGIVLAMGGDKPSPALEQAYTLIVFLGLPAMTVAAGIFSLYLLAGDLAERLRVAADTDSLTSAPNRRAIEAAGTRMMAQARRTGRPLTIALCDLDHFKEINDLYGHAVGDEVLCRLAMFFSAQMGGLDHFGRFGGEEFILLFPGEGAKAAQIHVEALRERIMDLTLGELPLQLTASFGVATLMPSDLELADLIQRADRALYASKQAGRNRTTIDRQPEPEPEPAE